MTYSSRDKLNGIYVYASLGFAAAVGAVSGDIVLCIVVATSLIGAGIYTRTIRPNRPR